MIGQNSHKAIRKFCIANFGKDIDYVDQLERKEDRDLFNRVSLGLIDLDENGNVIKAQTDPRAC